MKRAVGAPTKGLLIPWLQVRVLRGSPAPCYVKVRRGKGRQSVAGLAAYVSILGRVDLLLLR